MLATARPRPAVPSGPASHPTEHEAAAGMCPRRLQYSTTDRLPAAADYDVGVAAGVAAPGVSTTGLAPTATTGVPAAAGVASPVTGVVATGVVI